MQLRASKLMMFAFRVNLGIHHFALYGLDPMWTQKFL